MEGIVEFILLLKININCLWIKIIINNSQCFAFPFLLLTLSTNYLHISFHYFLFLLFILFLFLQFFQIDTFISHIALPIPAFLLHIFHAHNYYYYYQQFVFHFHSHEAKPRTLDNILTTIFEGREAERPDECNYRNEFHRQGLHGEFHYPIMLTSRCKYCTDRQNM